MLNRPVLLCLLALAAVVACLGLRHGPAADAVAPAQVVGVYSVKLKGDGWLRAKAGSHRSERITGSAVLTMVRVDPSSSSDGRIRVEIRLAPAMANGVADLATPEPAFVGEGYVVGDSLTAVDTGLPTYVNALTMSFTKFGARVQGHWFASFPATSTDQGPASAIAVEFSGRRTPARVQHADRTGLDAR
jgi:hypothetical protein